MAFESSHRSRPGLLTLSTSASQNVSQNRRGRAREGLLGGDMNTSSQMRMRMVALLNRAVPDRN